MLGKTSISALRTLVFLAQKEQGEVWSPRRLAEELAESPTYLAKVVRHLARRGLLEAERGVKGGVRLVKAPGAITLLEVVEACQGTIVGDFCRSNRPASTHCGFHRAALELHDAITGVLGRWTLQEVLARPAEDGKGEGGVTCLMAGALRGAGGLTSVGGPW